MGLLCKLEREDVPYNPRYVPCFYARRCHGADVFYPRCRYQPLAIGCLVRACRLLYVESVPLLYTNTSFVIDYIHNFNVFCKAISVNQQFAPPPLMFVRDIRISVTSPELRYIRDINAGLTLLTEQAVNLKRFELAVRESRVDGRDTRADIWYGERRPLLKETLRILGSFRGLEHFDLYFMLSTDGRRVRNRDEMLVIPDIFRELVSQPKGSGTMTARQFHNHFKIRYQALMAQRLIDAELYKRKLLNERNGLGGI